MNTRKSLRFRLLGIARGHDDRKRVRVQRYEYVPIARSTKRRRTSTEGQTVVLLAFLLLVLLWMNFGPHSRFLMQ
jgi:hypothetical protein